MINFSLPSNIKKIKCHKMASYRAASKSWIFFYSTHFFSVHCFILYLRDFTTLAVIGIISGALHISWTLTELKQLNAWEPVSNFFYHSYSCLLYTHQFSNLDTVNFRECDPIFRINTLWFTESVSQYLNLMT